MTDVDETALAAAQVNDPSATVDATEPSEATKPETTETPEKPTPGTPDKALQRLQQEVGNISRQYAALMEKQATGQLTEADQAKLAKSTQRLDTIRAKAQDIGLHVDGGTELAEQVLDLTEKVSKQDLLEAENRDMKARLARLENDRNWQIAKAKYSGLDVDAIWEKANVDAEEILGDTATPAAKNRLASKWFEERCDAAKKRQGDDETKKPKGTATSPAASYKVGTAQRVAPVLSDEDDALAMARSLVVDI